MTEQRVADLVEDCSRLFSKRSSLMSFWEEVAANFYPERLGFVGTYGMGADFSSHLSSGYPSLVRRDLANAFSSMLRPKGQEWFRVTISREDRLDHEGKAWLEWATGALRRAMMDDQSRFDRATTEGDHDFATFGQCVISKELNARDQTLLFRCWHIKDVAWEEDYTGEIHCVYRKWRPTLGELKALFPSKLHDTHEDNLRQPGGRHREVDCIHVVKRSDSYEPPEGGKKWRTPWVSIYIDVENKHILEERGLYHRFYTIPRWQTVSGSPYAYSPATVVALPDARLIQAMTLSLLEVGEKAANPPMLARDAALRSNVNLFAGGITSVDAEYDQRLEDIMRPMVQDRSGLQYGLEMRNDTRAMINEAFFLNKLNLPNTAGDMTAYEVGQRVQEYIRNALPLFGPMQGEYNHALCDDTFTLCLRNGLFGPMQDLPESLVGAGITFTFESPIHEAAERQKGGKLLEGMQMIGAMAQLDQSAHQIADAKTALRDVLEGIGWPTKWTRSQEAIAQMEQQQAAQQQLQGMLSGMQQGADVAKTLGEAKQSFAPTEVAAA